MNAHAWRFFHQNAGGVVGESALGAAALARAEETAQVLGLTFEWVNDDTADPDETLLAQPVYGCIVHGPGYKHLDSLWGIIDPSPEYVRIVQAELALQAIDTFAQRKAEDRLRAAAPELLAALKGLVEFAEVDWSDTHSAMRNARAAIAKAEDRS